MPGGSTTVPVLDDPPPGLQWGISRTLTVDPTGATVVSWTPVLEPTLAAWVTGHVEVAIVVIVALGALVARIRPILALVGRIAGKLGGATPPAAPPAA